VTVFDAGEDAGDLYIVMEFVDGPSLAELLARNGPLPVDETVRISRQVASALAAAHAAGIVHRDVKPANILIGADGDTKLADFGIAKRFDDLGTSVTSTGMVIGTPRYLAPEQGLGQAATPATDVYSLGVVMFEMLTGRVPSDAETIVATPGSQQSTALLLRSRRPDVSAALAEVVARALAMQPDQRPATAGALLEALDAAWSAHAGPTRVAEPTLVMPSAGTSIVGGSPDTEVLVLSPTTAQPTAGEGSSGRTAVVLFAGLLVLLAGAVAAATLGPDGGDDVAVVATVSSTAAASTVSAPSDTARLTVAPEVIEPTVIESTVVDPTTVTLFPGFPATDDLEVFLLQVERNPELLGQSGAELADGLRKVVEQRGAKQREAVDELREQLVVWVEADEIPAAVADALEELIAPLADKG
jgi:serine/threonine-protein kinase